jgi:hypothetical protein
MSSPLFTTRGPDIATIDQLPGGQGPVDFNSPFVVSTSDAYFACFGSDQPFVGVPGALGCIFSSIMAPTDPGPSTITMYPAIIGPRLALMIVDDARAAE